LSPTLRNWLIGVGAAVVVWALVGFALAPGLIRSAIIDNGGRVLVTRPTLERVRVNPFALSIALEHFAVPDPSGRTAFGFDRLYLRLDPSGIFRGAWTLGEFRITRPVANAALLPDSSLNLARLMRPSTAPPDTSGKTVPLLIRKLIIEDGAVSYEDMTRNPEFHKALKPIHIELTDFSTKRDSRNRYTFTAASDAGERLAWSGRFEMQPFRSDGTLEIDGLRAESIQSYLGELLPFDLARGAFDFSARYELNATTDPPDITLDQMAAQIRDLAVQEKRTGTELIAVASGALHGGEASVARRHATLDSITVDGLHIRGWMMANNHMNFESWVPAGKVDTAQVWTIGVPRIHASGVNLIAEDRRFSKPALFSIHGGTVSVDSFSTAPHAHFPIAFACSLGVGGRAEGHGVVTPDLPRADLMLDVRNFDLRSIQPYVALSAKIDVKSGTADAKGRLRFNAFGAKGPQMKFEGRADSKHFASVDHRLQNDFLKWSDLELNGLAMDILPTRVVVRGIDITQPYIRAVVAADRTTNVGDLIVSPDSIPAAFRSTVVDTPYTQIDSILVHDGSMYFADLTLTPNFATGIQKLNGEIRELSSSDQAHAAIDLKGEVDAYSPVTIAGTLNPLNGKSDLDLSVVFKNIELTTFTPYSGKFAGYRIEKGKLNLDLNYKIHGRELQATNKIFINQLTLGEKVASPDATKLPIRFAIALLKDKDGNIDLNLPVHGNLDDPKFSVGAIIIKVLLNLLTKAVTSPFKLLGAAFGGGGDKDEAWISYAPGSATIAPSETLKVSTLAKGLADRPALKLEVQEAADAAVDSAAIVRAKFDRKLHDARAAEAQATGKAVDLNSPITPVEYQWLIGKVYVAQFGKLEGADAPQKIKGKRNDPAVIAAENAEQERVTKLMEARVIASIHLEPTEIVELGRDRARSVREAVLSRGAIEPERVFIVANKGELPADSTGVRQGLSLTD
jgi:Domain of Unknown Function (DUF748)